MMTGLFEARSLIRANNVEQLVVFVREDLWLFAVKRRQTRFCWMRTCGQRGTNVEADVSSGYRVELRSTRPRIYAIF